MPTDDRPTDNGNNSKNDEKGVMAVLPAKLKALFAVLNSAVESLPQLAIAKGVLGVFCVIAIIEFYNKNLLAVAISIFVMIGMMFGLQLFVATAKQPDSTFRLNGIVMIWAIEIIIITIIVLCVSCFFVHRPITYVELAEQFYKNPLVKSEEEKSELATKLSQQSDYKTMQAQLNDITQDKIRLRLAAAKLDPEHGLSNAPKLFTGELEKETSILVNRKTISSDLANEVNSMFENALAAGLFSATQKGLLDYIHEVLTRDIIPEEKAEELREHISTKNAFVEPK